MRQAVAQLYAHIIKFLIRAIKWYSASNSRHVWDSLARPVELCYADIITEIESCTKVVDNVAVAASWAEQRDIHLEVLRHASRVDNLEHILIDMRQMMIGELLSLQEPSRI
jgi:hypothetical protein